MPTLYWTDLSGQVQTVIIESTQSESHEDVVTITDHPVEQGVNISDHAKSEPSFYTVEGYIGNIARIENGGQSESRFEDVLYPSNPVASSKKLEVASPTYITPSIRGVANALINKDNSITYKYWKYVPPAIATIKYKGIFAADRNLPQDAYNKLLDAKSNHYLISVITPFRQYGELLIQRLSVPRSPEDGVNALKFQIDLKEIRIVNSQTVEVPIPVEARGAARKNSGGQSPKTVIPEVQVVGGGYDAKPRSANEIQKTDQWQIGFLAGGEAFVVPPVGY